MVKWLIIDSYLINLMYILLPAEISRKTVVLTELVRRWYGLDTDLVPSKDKEDTNKTTTKPEHSYKIRRTTMYHVHIKKA